MEKQKRWQFYLIVAVIALTLINILPTVFFYTKPLKEPVDEGRAQGVALEIIERVNSLEADSQAWLQSFCKLIGIKPKSVALKADDPGLFAVSFNTVHDANLFSRFINRAGALIPFVPAQLALYSTDKQDQSVVYVARQINVRMDPADVESYFHYYPKYRDGAISAEFRAGAYDRVTQLALSFAGTSKEGQQLAAIAHNPTDPRYNDVVIALARAVVDAAEAFGVKSPAVKRYFASFTQVEGLERGELVQKWLARIDSLKKDLENQRKPLVAEQQKLQAAGEFQEASAEQRLAFIDNQYKALDKAGAIISENKALFAAGQKPLSVDAIGQSLKASEAKVDLREPMQYLSFEGRNPFVEGLVLDWSNDRILVKLYGDVLTARLDDGKTEESVFLRDKINSMVINEIARVSRLTDETIAPEGNEFALALTNLTNAKTFLSYDLGALAQALDRHYVLQLLAGWQPEHADLNRKVFPVVGYDVYKTLSPQEQKLGLVVYAPAAYKEEPLQGFRETSIYVIARGMDNIVQKYRETPDAPGGETLMKDINNLSDTLKSKGYISYSGASFGIDSAFSQDTIFELNDYYLTLLNATREDFYVKGSKRAAILDFTDVEQRIIALNRIEDKEQEDLLKWRDEYNAAQVDLKESGKYEVPAPTKNVYWQNMKLSFVKYFRGDDRKILRWGLDLSGGKTVRIGLRDQNNRVVTDPEDLKQVVNELYVRINKMGVAERTIRIENNNIILDFPGSQAMSASELVKASAMYFHIVNEKFSPGNANLRDTANAFLQNVWNEAVVTNRKDSQSVNEIAWEHLGGSRAGGQATQPRNEHAKILYESGLRLADPRTAVKSSAFDDTLSAIGVLRGDEFSEWDGQSHPLIIIFHNYGLEGSSLTNVHVGYDPTEGNNLSFGVKGSYEGSHGRGSGSPREDFYTWTSQFAEDKIAGTPKEVYTAGHGWRMAVILNDTIITKPHLRAALRDGGTISGKFTQREISQLAADLKAGSLSFTPRILSEQNVSAELGQQERIEGIMASFVGLVLVAVAMIGYYRFAGLVATCAVMLNLLIMWGVLQNLGAALTLPGIAGIVLTIGMAVDANVLVFERFREEFAISGRLASAIQAGYRKAFSAIVDSNITTIIAALILIQFDSGPIKGFAITLIIGLVSSMFTALFMTRYFFAGWVKNPNNKELRMAELVGGTKFDFLGLAKKAIVFSLILMVAGGYLFVSQRNTMFGMDFTGGYSLSVELEEKPGEALAYRSLATDALLSHGATATDFEIRQLSKPNQLRIQLSLAMEEEGHPFYGLPLRYAEGDFGYEYEKDPRIVWVVNTLSSAGLDVQNSELETLEANWSMMSGQFSSAMRDNAVMALVLALVSILIYITLRFEFKYAIGAVVALGHDVVITLGILALFHKMGLPVQVDLQVVGAIMTIIGYSLNDTIIVFDRVREDAKLLRKLSFGEVINHAINVTLSRTIMTSGTTLLVLLSLVLLGGHSILDFSLVMTIGVVVGTFSSLFIAGPVMLYFHHREELSQDAALKGA